MAMATGNDLSTLVKAVFEEGHRLSFFQAVYLLERLYPDAPVPGDANPLEEEKVRFEPHTGMAFPPTDIRSVQRETALDGSERIKMVLTFMGLYGGASPLPDHISQFIATEQEGSPALKAFLDIFNHRLYSLFYRAWRKYRYHLQFKPEGDDTFSRYMMCLVGLGTPKLGDLVGVSPVRLLAYGGLVGSRVHSREGLRTLLSDYFGGIRAEVQEFVPRWVPLPERSRLGRPQKERAAAGGSAMAQGITPARLGVNTVLGERLLDCAGKIRVVLGPLSLEAYRAFLPGGAQSGELEALVRLYVPDQLDFDVALSIRREEIPAVLGLGGELAQLSRTSWLGKPSHAIETVVLPRRSVDAQAGSR